MFFSPLLRAFLSKKKPSAASPDVSVRTRWCSFVRHVSMSANRDNYIDVTADVEAACSSSDSTNNL